MTPIIGVIDSAKTGRLAPSSGWTAIATATATGGESSITMSGIPATYSHLVVRISARINITFQNNNSLIVRLNGDSGSNYNFQQYEARNTGSATSGASASAGVTYLPPGDIFPSNTRTNFFGAAQLLFTDYASTTKQKSMVFHGGMNVEPDAIRYTRKGGGIYRSTSPITSITFIPQYTFAANSTFALYGVI